MREYVTLKRRDYMAKIRRIEPNIPRLGGRKRVAAYARVAMETELLHHSLHEHRRQDGWTTSHRQDYRSICRQSGKSRKNVQRGFR